MPAESPGSTEGNFTLAEAEKAPAPSAGFQKNWADAAAALLGPVAPRQQLTSAFSAALATRAGKSSHYALFLSHNPCLIFARGDISFHTEKPFALLRGKKW